MSYYTLYQKENTHRLTQEEKSFEFQYKLDDFQEEGMYRIHNNENILVTAHTGSGKTTFALYGIGQALKRNSNVIYTSPIKSLSNQKYAEFKKMFGINNVGILTGDIKMNPTAPCMIMTTEILRNMLYKKDEETLDYMNKVSVVIFDEVHYINDKDRGKVWEEVIILLPKNVILIMLSATIEGAPEFAQWVGKIKERNTTLIPTSHRVVPLKHYVYKGCVYEDGNNDYLEEMCDLIMDKDNSVVNIQEIRKNYKVRDLRTMLNDILNQLSLNRMTPALFFVFSRSLCEKLSYMVNIQLIDHNVRSKIIETFNKYMLPYKEVYEKLPQYNEIYELVQKGIAYHHSGMLPILKEIVEILFGLGYVKVLFATETFAVGVNMPTKTVLFPSLEKYDNKGIRYINHAEYMQMSGRAGRRGLDPVGNVIIIPSMELPSDNILVDILSGKSPKVESKFVPTYQFVLKHIYYNSMENSGEINNFLTNTYFMDSHGKNISNILKRKNELEKNIENIEKEIKIEKKDVEEYMKNKKKMNGNGQLGQYFVMKEKDKRKIEKEIEGIRKKYVNFDENIKMIEDVEKLKKELYNVENEMDEGSTFLFQNISNMKDMLYDYKYIDNEGKLTQRGMIGMGINECNELLFAYLLDNYINEDLTYAEWIGLFGLFVEEKDLSHEEKMVSTMKISNKMKSIIRNLEEEMMEIANDELKYKINIGSTYELHYDFVETLYQWASGVEYTEIIKEKKMFDGNFVKAVLRTQNIVDDVKNICKELKNYEMLVKLENAEIPLIRDIAQINSLYIKM